MKLFTSILLSFVIGYAQTVDQSESADIRPCSDRAYFAANAPAAPAWFVHIPAPDRPQKPEFPPKYDPDTSQERSGYFRQTLYDTNHRQYASALNKWKPRDTEARHWQWIAYYTNKMASIVEGPIKVKE